MTARHQMVLGTLGSSWGDSQARVRLSSHAAFRVHLRAARL